MTKKFSLEKLNRKLTPECPLTVLATLFKNGLINAYSVSGDKLKITTSESADIAFIFSQERDRLPKVKSAKKHSQD